MISSKDHKNIYSQNGEDGIIERICFFLKIQCGFFCEFGAWDGEHLSNCKALYEKGWAGLFIEGDKKRFLDLESNYKSASKIILLNEYVSPEGETSLDSILKKNNVTTVDLLSIDIDGDDLLIWRSIKSVRPKIVIVEYNPTIPFDTRFDNPIGENKGNSALSIVEFAKAWDYVLVAGTECNLLFIERTSLVTETPEISLFSLSQNVPGIRYFFGYDGSFIMSNGITSRTQEIFLVPWTKFVTSQPVPRYLRGYEKYDIVRLVFSLLSIIFHRPLSLIRLVVSRIWSSSK